MDVAKFQNRKDKRNVFLPLSSPLLTATSRSSADTFFILADAVCFVYAIFPDLLER